MRSCQTLISRRIIRGKRINGWARMLFGWDCSFAIKAKNSSEHWKPQNMSKNYEKKTNRIQQKSEWRLTGYQKAMPFSLKSPAINNRVSVNWLFVQKLSNRNSTINNTPRHSDRKRKNRRNNSSESSRLFWRQLNVIYMETASRFSPSTPREPWKN